MRHNILKDLRKVVTEESITKLAFKHKFCQRSTSQIHGIDFLKMLIHQMSSGIKITYNSLNASLRCINAKICISNQAISKYLCRVSSANFLRSIYEKVFHFQKTTILLPRLPKEQCDVFDTFGQILIEDSTYCSLKEMLLPSYKGYGGTGSKAGLKINVIHEFKGSLLKDLCVLQGNFPDSKNTDRILDFALKGDLVLRDLGYSNLNSFLKLTDRGIYFISRYHSSICVYEDKGEKHAIDLGRFLTRKMKKRSTLDIELYFGETKRKYRLIAYRVPENVANSRRRKVKRSAQCHRRMTSKGRLTLCDFVIMITNIPVTMVEAEVIGTIYRIRWTIELLFKSWKSHLNLQVSLTEGQNRFRIECCLYAILIIVLLTMLLKRWLESVASSNREISLVKIAQWLVFIRGVFKLLFKSINRLQDELNVSLNMIYNQVRSRKTTIERVASEESYSFQYNNQFLIG